MPLSLSEEYPNPFYLPYVKKNVAWTTLFVAMNTDGKPEHSNDSQADKDSYDRNAETTKVAKTAPKIAFRIQAFSGVLKCR
tara:strand:- start:803 stop:1045 length:243 start_codon:yes stop_codon:yes gene_type:complete